MNSLHEEDSLYKAQGGKAAYQISPTYGQNTLYKVNPVHDAWDRALAAESICQDILSSARNQLYLNMRFIDCALSALFFQGDMGVHPVGTDGTVLYYQPEELMEQYRKNIGKVKENLKRMLPEIGLTGQWSMDIMQNGNDFYLIDMALAENSALKECVPKSLLKKVEEDWIPRINTKED